MREESDVGESQSADVCWGCVWTSACDALLCFATSGSPVWILQGPAQISFLLGPYLDL